MNFLSVSQGGFLGDLGNSPIFWIILVLIIAFIVYSGLKKNKKEKKQRKQREKEVKDLIKKHLKKTENLSNVEIKYLDVFPRSGKKYKTRDIYDVFIEIKNNKNNKLISKKAYEIEGVAKPIEKKTKDQKEEEYLVKWSINREFDYKKHYQIFHKKIKSSLAIYFQSLKKKRPKSYIQREKKLKKEQEMAKADLDKNLKQVKKDYQIFQPKTNSKKDE